MSKVGTRLLIWRGGEHEFCLAGVSEIFALEEACKAGIMEIMRRLESELWRLNDVRETIRLGLIGAGMDATRAMTLVKLHVDGNPNGLAPSVILAHHILSAALIGVPDDPVGKNPAAEAATGQDSSTTTAASAAPQSTATPRDSDGPLETSTPAPSGSSPPPSTATTAPTASTQPLSP